MKKVTIIMLVMISLIFIFIQNGNSQTVEDHNGNELGNVLKSDELSIMVYNEDTNSVFTVKGNGYFKFPGPEENNEHAIYYTSNNCTGTGYYYGTGPFKSLFSSRCPLGGGDFILNQNDNLYIGERVEPIGGLKFYSYQKIMTSKCSGCVPSVLPQYQPKQEDIIYRINQIREPFPFPIQTPIKIKNNINKLVIGE
jgi:hypothetical protein